MDEWIRFGLGALVALVGAMIAVGRIMRDAEKRLDALEHTVYDAKGTNGLVRRMKALEGEVLTPDEIKMAARHEARNEVQKVVETLERIYEGKRK